MLLALLTGLAFVSLVSSTATHVHATLQATHDCAICSLAQDQADGDLLLPVLALTQFFVLFTLATLVLRSASYLMPLTLPHSCGPPHRD